MFQIEGIASKREGARSLWGMLKKYKEGDVGSWMERSRRRPGDGGAFFFCFSSQLNEIGTYWRVLN